MLKKINCFETYILLWLFYLLQGTLYESGGVISQSVLFLILSISLLDVYKVNRLKVRPLFFKGSNLLLFLITIYGILRYQEGNWDMGWNVIPWYGFLKDHYISILPIYVFYYFSINKQITLKKLKIAAFLLFVVYVLFFIRIQIEYSTKLNRDDITNNSAYLFVSLLALIPLLKFKTLQSYFLIAIPTLFVILTAKRGAILITLICLIIFMIFVIKSASKKTKIVVQLLSFIFVMVGFFAIKDYISTNEYLSNRLQDTMLGNSSGRDLLAESLLNYIKNDNNVLHLFLGNGADSTVKIAGNFAHNDWLEIMCNMGVLGIMIYILYWTLFYKSVKSLKSYGFIYCSFFMVFIFCLIRTFFSMSINDMPLVISLVLGYCLSYTNTKNQVKNE